MSSRAETSSIGLFGLGREVQPQASVADIASILSHSGAKPRVVTKPAYLSKQRTRIWELHHSLHCSVIGTCLTTGELVQLLRRLDVHVSNPADHHGVHQLGVILAARPLGGARHLQKTLDRKHKLAINQFAKAKDAIAIAALWDEAVKRGDIPGAYWALLTHSATTEALVKRVFGEVHMLSHLVGAANRADIRRLRQLEEDNAILSATIERQQQQLRDGFTFRDETIRRLSDALARKVVDGVSTVGIADDTGALQETLADREKLLAEELIRRDRLEKRLAKLTTERDEADRARLLAEQERDVLRTELASTENQFAVLLPGENESAADALDLNGGYVLYVGGRPHQTPRLKGLVERTNGRFLHHDGGLEHNAALLPGLVSRADLVVFPVDCVSHEAAAVLKRACRQLEKRYLPLRTSSLTCLFAGLATAAERLPPAQSSE